MAWSSTRNGFACLGLSKFRFVPEDATSLEKIKCHCAPLERRRISFFFFVSPLKAEAKRRISFGGEAVRPMKGRHVELQ